MWPQVTTWKYCRHCVHFRGRRTSLITTFCWWFIGRSWEKFHCTNWLMASMWSLQFGQMQHCVHGCGGLGIKACRCILSKIFWLVTGKLWPEERVPQRWDSTLLLHPPWDSLLPSPDCLPWRAQKGWVHRCKQCGWVCVMKWDEKSVLHRRLAPGKLEKEVY